MSFYKYLISKSIRTELVYYIVASVVVYIVFSILYPEPFMFPDSGSYVLSAYDPTAFNIYRPMGYSSYLSLVHGISPSLGFMTGTTYFLHILSTLTLLFSARFLLGWGRRGVFVVITVCALFAPTALFATNFVMSDSLFASLTMLFLASALWILFLKNWWLIVAHLLLFWALYSVRYSGMLYVPISMLALLFSPLPRKTYYRILLAISPIVIASILFANVKSEYREHTGVDTFSAFNGWQLLNNASVLIPGARNVNPAIISDDEQVRYLHEFFTQYPDSVFSTSMALSTSLMWSNTLPLKQFTFLMLEQNPKATYPAAWVNVGVIYEKYAKALIANDPMGYLTKYIAPSLATLVKNQNITEQVNVVKNEPMYERYYGLSYDTYTHSNQGLWDFFNTCRRWFNPLYWVLTIGAIASFLVTNRRVMFSEPVARCGLLLIAFIVVYLIGSAVASPCTTWRYSLPFFTPSLILIATSCRYLCHPIPSEHHQDK